MAKSVLELAVGTGQWDAGLKKAKSALDNFTQSQGGLQQALAKDSENMRKFVGMMGQMDSSAKTAKGQMNDYKATIEQLTMQYNRMTESQKQTIGQDYLQSIDQLKQKYQAVNEEIQEMNRSLNNVKAPDIADGVKAGGLFGGGKLDGMLQVFGGNLMTKGVELATSAVTSLISETGDMIKQGVELAKQGEGIRIAFDRLGRGDIMDGLREATHGTVTDLELMKAAVKFNDFKLPLDELGTMLAFAQQKAKDTGQSVDFLVESIVNGLGRKSLMILDNLGLSATEIKERMKETGDMTKAVGAIIRDQMAAAGDYVETAADRAAQANVSLQNKMEELGRKFAPVEEASNQLWTSMKIGILDIIGGPLARLLNELTEAGRRLNAMNDVNGNDGNGQSLAQRRLNTLREYSGSQKGVTKQTVYDRTVARYAKEEEQAWRKANEFAEKYKNTLKELDNVDPRTDEKGVQASAIQQQANKYKQQQEKYTYRAQAIRSSRAEYQQGAQQILNPITPVVDTQKAETNVKKLRQQLKELEEQRKKAVKAGDQEQVDNLTKQISQTKTNLSYLDPSATKGVKAVQDDFTEITGLIGNAQERVSDLQRRIKEAPDETTISILRDQLKEAQAELDRLNGKKVEMAQGLSGFNTQTMGAWLQGRQGDLSKTELGSVDYSKIMGNIADMQTIKSILEKRRASGIDAAQFNLESLWEKVFDGENIPDDVWQNIVDTINEKLAELKLEPIKLDFKTGNIANIGKETEKSWRGAASAMSAAGSALQGLEDPGAKIAGIVGQAIANIALGFSQATAASSGGGIFGWIAAIAGGLTTMLSTISAIHSATGYAQGGIVDGRGGGFVGGMAYSGDNVGNVRLDSGELVLNRSQQNNLANALEGGNNNNVENRQPYVNGELIYLGVNNYLKRTGRGEIVVSKR